jgi:hypothetical protein
VLETPPALRPNTEAITRSTLAGLEMVGTTDELCDDCDNLSAGWPCADCYIHGGAEVTADV